LVTPFVVNLVGDYLSHGAAHGGLVLERGGGAQQAANRVANVIALDLGKVQDFSASGVG